MIRPCEPYELYKILPMARQFFDMADEPGEFNPDHLMKYCHSVYAQGKGLVLVEERDGEFKSMMGLITYPEPATGNLTMSECFLFTSGGRSAGLLVRKSEEVFRASGAKAYYIHHRHGDDRVGQFYSNRGFKPVFARWVKEA